ncbi:hypothetical protein Tco_1221672, partial [Tanacetum coccineum]
LKDQHHPLRTGTTILKRIETEAVKAELLKLGLHKERNEAETLNVLSGNKSSTYQLNSSLQMIIFSLLTGTTIDIGEIIYNDLVTRLTYTTSKKYVAYPRFISYVLKKNSSEVQPIGLTKYMLSVVRHQALVSPTPPLEKAGKKKSSQTMTKPKPKSNGLEDSGVPSK